MQPETARVEITMPIPLERRNVIALPLGGGDRGCYYRDYYYRDYYSGVRGLSIGAARARTNVATAAVTCLRTLPWNDRVTKLPHGWRACSAPYAQPSGWAWWSLLAAWRPPRLPPPR